MARIWRAPPKHGLATVPLGRALWRHGIGFDLRWSDEQWCAVFFRDGVEIGSETADDPLDALIAALPRMPGIGPRLALLGMVL